MRGPEGQLVDLARPGEDPALVRCIAAKRHAIVAPKGPTNSCIEQSMLAPKGRLTAKRLRCLAVDPYTY